MDGDRAAEVREQVKRLFSHPLLKNSRRCRSFLQFVVEETLEGRAAELKERTVGIAVFGRDLEYDTNVDHVVRTAACELRRRLIQYYQQTEHAAELRICLPPGAYTPSFEMVADPSDPPRRDAPMASPGGLPYFATGLILLAALAMAGSQWPRKSAIDRFWRPFLESPESVLLCVGTFFVPEPVLLEADAMPSRFTRYLREAMPSLIASGDSNTTARLAGLLTAKGKRFRIRTQSSSTLADLREGPTVLIGALNNTWSLRLMEQMRYSLVWDADRNVVRIRDRKDPARETWQGRADWPIEPGMAQLQEDFALISRVWDPTTGSPVLIAGGLTMLGTAAAGEFLSDPKRMDELAASAPKGWDRKNLQVVIATRLIGGDSAPPRVQAIEAW
jgi:hypothetical protein